MKTSNRIRHASILIISLAYSGIANSSDLREIPYSGSGCAPNLSYLLPYVPTMLKNARSSGMEDQIRQEFTKSIDASVPRAQIDQAIVSMRIQTDQAKAAYESARGTVDAITEPSMRGRYPVVAGKPNGSRETALEMMHISREQWITNWAMIRALECRRR